MAENVLLTDLPKQARALQFFEHVGPCLAQHQAGAVFLADIVKNTYVISVEFFTATIPASDFNDLRQYINLSIIEMIEERGIKLASKEV